MELPYRLAVVDVDDTLLGPDKSLSAENRRAVGRLQRADCRVVLASGRRHENVARYYAELGLDDFVVSCQGARVQHVRDLRVLHRAEVPGDVSQRLAVAGRDFGFTVIVWRSDGIHAAAPSPWVERYGTETGGEAIRVGQVHEPWGAVEKLVWLGEPESLVARAGPQRSEAGPDITLTVAHDWCLEFAHRSADKGIAAAAIAGAAAIPREAVVAFGDGYNDVGLLKWAGMGVAMAHGRPNARAAARCVAPDGDPHTAFARAVQAVFARSDEWCGPDAVE